MWPLRILITLCGWADWSESLLGAHVQRYADLNLHWVNMPKGTFSKVVAHLLRLVFSNSYNMFCYFAGTFGKVYSGTLLSEDDKEVADQEVFVKTITGKYCSV